MEIIPNECHRRFFEQQISALEREWLAYARAPVRTLIAEKRLVVGKLWSILQDGTAVLRFRVGQVPRIKQPFLLREAGPEFPLKLDDLTFSYRDFVFSTEVRYYSGRGSDIFTLGIQSVEQDFIYVQVSGLDEKLSQYFLNQLLHCSGNPTVVIAERDPPIEYLRELLNYVTTNPAEPILNLNANVEESNWIPSHLDNSKDILDELISIIDSDRLTLIQGPPGTGKSYLAAQLCAHYLVRGQSIVVTSLTNKALMEIANKSGLQNSILHGRVYKSNLSADEAHRNAGLRSMESLTPLQGELCLCTFYMMALWQKDLLPRTERFDLLIIEEASQAFLASIAMFSSIAKRVLVIGDHKQLVPIVVKEPLAMRIHRHIPAAIKGLETLAFNNSARSYRLTHTRRLSTSSARLTGLFYSGTLTSISTKPTLLIFKHQYRLIEDESLGNSVMKLSASLRQHSKDNVLIWVAEFIKNLLVDNPEVEIAILIPSVSLETQFYERFAKSNISMKRVIVSTVHKIQGLTVDFTVLYIPLENPSFELNDNLFNVATSRARYGTLIITSRHVDLVSNVSPEVLKFIASCRVLESF